jgi:hypothetical protein
MQILCRGVIRRTVVLIPVLILAAVFGPRMVQAESAAFDLSGPRVEMKVTRGNKPLPIADVANLQPGDRIWVHPDLPESQSARYLLIVVFLRGSTNPPPDSWFIKLETWRKQVREEGAVVTVPQEAQQALIFLAPETGGDFSTLRNAVQGKPGAFVRASQDLNQASLDRTRLEKYLTDIHQASDLDPKELQERSELLARTLNIKVDQKCFDKPFEQQAACLTQNTDQLVLNDGHSQSMVAALTTGPGSDLIGNVSASPMAAGGFYSAYVGAVVDLARLMSTMHTAEYQYIPALALPTHEQLNLKLNNPPSFHNPKSVLVVGLPAVESPQLPPLRAVNTDAVYCLQKSPLILPVDGAPLVFSTDIAHDFVLRVAAKSGGAIDLPAVADAASGGFVINTHLLDPSKLDNEVKATLHGYWGFEPYDGPSFHLRLAHPENWTIPAEDQGALVVGRNDALHLDADCAACVQQVSVEDSQGKDMAASWKLLTPEELEVEVPLKNEAAGSVKLIVKQWGVSKPDEIPLRTYAEAARLDQFTIAAGDEEGVLRGTRLDEVDSFELKGVHFVPAKLSRADQKDELSLAAPTEAAPIESLQPAETLVAHVGLKDGRVLDLQTTVEPPRPKIILLSKSVQGGPSLSAIRLGNQDELPQDGRMSFFLKTVVPDEFPHTERIEVSTADGTFDAFLSMADGTLVLQDSRSVLAVLDPLKSFGPSAFGLIRFRAAGPDGQNSDWHPLARLVRIPTLKEIRCPDSPDKPCTLGGSNLFLIDSVASDPQFTHTIPVPAGFVDSTLSVPRPNGTLLYIKLRDDPKTVSTLVLPVLPEEQ